jgi:hypothetical protein
MAKSSKNVDIEKNDKKIEEAATEVEEVAAVGKEDKVDKNITVKEPKKILTKKELRNRAHTIEVEVMNLTNGSVYYRCKKTGEVIELNESGDSAVTTLDILLNMRNQSKKMLDNMHISIVDVFEDDIDVNDILKMLDLKKAYCIDEMTVEGIDKYIISLSGSEFEKIVNESDIRFIRRLAERSVSLDKEKKLDSDFKRNVLIKKLNKEYLFKSY